MNIRRIIKGVLTSAVLPILTFAAPVPSINPRSSITINDVFSWADRAMTWILTVVSIVAVVMLIYAGFLFMTGAGNDDKIKKAKDLLFYAIVGVVVVFLSFSIVSFVNSLLG